MIYLITGFNTQPPEGGWVTLQTTFDRSGKVSTHSRPKAAGADALIMNGDTIVSTHSRPKAAGYPNGRFRNPETVSTHSRPKAAGYPASFS